MRDLEKRKMVKYCVEIWPKEVIQEGPVSLPWYGSEKEWVCIALYKHVNTREQKDEEELSYAECWLRAEVENEGTRVYKVTKEKNKEEEIKGPNKKWDPLDCIPPLATPAPAIQQEIPVPPENSMEPRSTHEEAEKPVESCEMATSLGVGPRKTEGPYTNTRAWTESCEGCCKKRTTDEKLFPLREVPMGGERGGIGFASAPLTTSEVRAFKKEMRSLTEDPIGVADQLNQFLGPSIYTWEEMNSILGILFSPEEIQLITTAGLQIWERESRPSPPGEEEVPLNMLEWDANDEIGHRNMRDYRSLIIKGI